MSRISEQAITEKLQGQDDHYCYAVEIFIEDGDGYRSAGEVCWSVSQKGAEKIAQEMLDSKHVPIDPPAPSGWVKVVVTESREVSVARYYQRIHTD